MNLRPATATALEAPRRAELAIGVIAGRQYREMTIPRTEIIGSMRLLSRAENAQVRADCRQRMEELRLNAGPLDGYTEWHEEVAVRTVAIAMRSPSDHDVPLAPLTDWIECDDDQINALWKAYQDLEAELDPLGEKGPALSELEIVEIRDAAKKKSQTLLTSYGSRKLALYLISLADPPSP